MNENIYPSVPYILVILVIFLIIRMLFEWYYLPWYILKDFKQRMDKLPTFKDVWEETRHLATLNSKQRRQYYRDKGGYPCYMATHFGKYGKRYEKQYREKIRCRV